MVDSPFTRAIGGAAQVWFGPAALQQASAAARRSLAPTPRRGGLGRRRRWARARARCGSSYAVDPWWLLVVTACQRQGQKQGGGGASVSQSQSNGFLLCKNKNRNIQPQMIVWTFWWRRRFLLLHTPYIAARRAIRVASGLHHPQKRPRLAQGRRGGSLLSGDGDLARPEQLAAAGDRGSSRRRWTRRVVNEIRRPRGGRPDFTKCPFLFTKYP
jgi:hypothetical protein